MGDEEQVQGEALMLQRWQTALAIAGALGAAGVWAADQRWATKAEAQTARTDHGLLHEEEAQTRAQMMLQLQETREAMSALREDIAFLRCFLDPRTDWDTFKQTCVERPHGALPTLAGRLPAVPGSATVPATASGGHAPAPTAETATP